MSIYVRLDRVRYPNEPLRYTVEGPFEHVRLIADTLLADNLDMIAEYSDAWRTPDGEFIDAWRTPDGEFIARLTIYDN